MLNAVAPRVLRSFTVLLNRKVSSGRPSSVSRPVVLLEDILSDLSNEEGTDSVVSKKDVVTSVRHNKSGVDSSTLRVGAAKPVIVKNAESSASKKDASGVYNNESAGSSSLPAGAKLCNKSCSGCPRSAANSKPKGKIMGQLHVPEVTEKGDGSVHSPASLEDCFVSRVGRAIEMRFRTK